VGAATTGRGVAGEEPGRRLELTSLSDVVIGPLLGEGGRSTCHAATWRGREVALKIYKPRAIVRHARKHLVPLAQFEHDRNLAFFQAAGLAAHVAEPLAYVSTPGVSAFVQERLDGELYYFWFKRMGSRIDPELYAHLARIVERSHAAGLFDVDLHSMNVMVVPGADGKPIPRLFDFNLIPVSERAPNPFVALLIRTGLMSVAERDRRKLRDFHDFRRVEKKLLPFYEAR
jgi:hypothetical protein